jgi:8-oxo-dGTP pyrophosphatase MutT (NUDIX family)
MRTWKSFLLRLLDFDDNRASEAPSAPPRDAATIVVLRQTGSGLEVFCVRRSPQSGYLGGALVFPGGKVDATDASESWLATATRPHARADAFATDTAAARTLGVTACRETLEEGGILPVQQALGDAAVADIAAELRAGIPLAVALAQRSLTLALDALIPFARWITPEAERRRFDARFYLLRLPEGQVGRHDQYETTMSFWAKPARILDSASHGEFLLAPPTSRVLELLSSVRDVESAMELAERQTLRPVCPQFVADQSPGAPYLALPGDPSHPIRERYVEGPSRYVLRSGRFVAEDPG